LQVYSDLHLEREAFSPPAKTVDLVVLAGDIGNGALGIEWAKAAFKAPVLYLPGNHEYYDGEFQTVNTAMQDASGGSIELLDCTCIVVSGVRFLGCTLWTDYSLAPESRRAAVIEDARKLNPDYQKIRLGLRAFAPEDSIALCAQHRAWLAGALSEPFPGKTVVITHFAPHPRSIAPAFRDHRANPAFVVDLEELMGRADLWIHGHTHNSFDYVVRGTRVLCNPRGYPGEHTGFQSSLTVEI
jgi:predicted phosphodiesterase